MGFSKCLWASALLLSQAGYGADVRTFSWGDSRASVVSKETAPRAPESFQRAPFQTEKGVSFFASSLGQEATLTYHFDDNRLSRAAFEFTGIHHYDPSDYLADYEKFRKLLAKEFGAQEAKDVWDNDQDSNTEGLDRSFAISDRRLKIVTTWRFKDTTVELILGGHPYFAATPRIWLVSTSNKYYGADRPQESAEPAQQVSAAEKAPVPAEQTPVP